MYKPTPGEIFNLVDDDPRGAVVVLRHAADLLRVRLPPGAPPERAADGRGDKRVSNDKAKRMLGWELRYPSYKAGLASVRAEELLEALASRQPGSHGRG